MDQSIDFPIYLTIPYLLYCTVLVCLFELVTIVDEIADGVQCLVYDGMVYLCLKGRQQEGKYIRVMLVVCQHLRYEFQELLFLTFVDDIGHYDVGHLPDLDITV